MSVKLRQAIEASVEFLSAYVPDGFKGELVSLILDDIGPDFDMYGEDAKYDIAAAFVQALSTVLERNGIDADVVWGADDMALYNARAIARASGDWAEADRLRDELQKRGHKIKDLN